jgi:hypothetical protein
LFGLPFQDFSLQARNFMATELITYADIAGMNNYMLYLERFPERIEFFKITLDLVPAKDYGKYIEPALDHVTRKAKEHKTLWSIQMKPLRQLHRDLEQFVADFFLFATQLEAYCLTLNRNTRMADVLRQSVSDEPFNLSGKLMVVSDSTVRNVLTYVGAELDRYQAAFATQAATKAIVRESSYSLIPRFIDFMSIKIVEAARRSVSESDVTSARSKQHWSRCQYFHALQAASNVQAYCQRLSVLLKASLETFNVMQGDSSVSISLFSLRLTQVKVREVERLSKIMTDILRHSI